MNVPVGRETLFGVMCVILAQSYLCVDFITRCVLFALGFVGFAGFVKEWVRKAERRDETTHSFLVKHQPPMAASQIPWMLAALSITFRGSAPTRGPPYARYTVRSAVRLLVSKRNTENSSAPLFFSVVPYISFYFLNPPHPTPWLAFQVGRSSWRPSRMASDPRGEGMENEGERGEI